jgi:hypothetical protein
MFSFKLTKHNLFLIFGLVSGFSGFTYFLSATGGLNHIMQSLTTNIIMSMEQANQLGVNDGIMYIVLPLIYFITLFSYLLNHKVKSSNFYNIIYPFQILSIISFVLFLISFLIEKRYNLNNGLSQLFFIFSIISITLLLVGIFTYYIYNLYKISNEMKQNKPKIMDQSQEYLPDESIYLL